MLSLKTRERKPIRTLACTLGKRDMEAFTPALIVAVRSQR